MALLLTSCLKRSEVEAEVWQQSGLPPELCAKTPELKAYGIYRKLDSGKYEFLSYCTEVQDENGKPQTAVKLYISINAQKFNHVLDELLPKVQETL